MAIKDYQTAILVSKKYATNIKSQSGLGENLKARITIIGGTGTVYASEEEPATLAEMALVEAAVSTGVVNTIPRYMAVVQDSGAITSVVLTSIDAEDLGAIA